jgi:hypothetical protein
LITITGLIVPATAASGASYNGIYGFLLCKDGKIIYDEFQGSIYLVKSKNKNQTYYSSSKKKLEKKLNKISKIVLKIQENGKYKKLKVIKKPKNGWELRYNKKNGKYTADIYFEFKTKTIFKNGVKGSIYAYNNQGKVIYKKTHFTLIYGLF